MLSRGVGGNGNTYCQKIQESQELIEKLEGQLKECGSGLFPIPSAYTCLAYISGDDQDTLEKKE